MNLIEKVTLVDCAFSGVSLIEKGIKSGHSMEKPDLGVAVTSLTLEYNGNTIHEPKCFYYIETLADFKKVKSEVLHDILDSALSYKKNKDSYDTDKESYNLLVQLLGSEELADLAVSQTKILSDLLSFDASIEKYNQVSSEMPSW